MTSSGLKSSSVDGVQGLQRASQTTQRPRRLQRAEAQLSGHKRGRSHLGTDTDEPLQARRALLHPNLPEKFVQ